MSIVEAPFADENELDSWVAANINDFLPSVRHIPGFRVNTISGKAGVPDGFAFDFTNREWYVIESELLAHGVWPHIAEQITRFVVALQNPDARRTVRDKLFDAIESADAVGKVSAELGIEPHRLLQQLELFIEGVSPTVLIFIDQTDRDLEDMVRGLNTEARIFRVTKLLVDGKPQYYSPDTKAPAIETEAGDQEDDEVTDYDIVEQLGGGAIQATIRRYKSYRLNDGTIIHIKRSRLYPDENAYWYGISASSIAHMRQTKVTHIVLIMGTLGFVKVPFETMAQYLATAYTSLDADGNTRHYHLNLTHGAEPELYTNKEQQRFPLKAFFHPLD